MSINIVQNLPKEHPSRHTIESFMIICHIIVHFKFATKIVLLESASNAFPFRVRHKGYSFKDFHKGHSF